MEEIKKLHEDFETCFDSLKDLVKRSFDLMHRGLVKKEEIINLWKHFITRFMTFTFETGEKYNNKDIFKAITKALIFGK